MTATFVVRAFYVCLFFLFISQQRAWDDWARLTELRLLWPVAWFRWTGTAVGVIVVVAGSLVASLLAAAWPGVRSFRAVAFVGVLLFGAFFNSFGSTMHGWHGWIWVAGVFVLLPDGAVDDIARSVGRAQRYRQVFWIAQAAVLLFYSLSGVFKVAAAFVQAAQGNAHAFSPDALARHTAYRLLEGAETRPYTFGPLLADYPWIGWLPYVVAVYIEFSSLLVAFRPAVHRTWAVALILFHLGVFFTMTILFSWQMLLVGVLFLCSPFAPHQVKLGCCVMRLPIIGDLLTLIRNRRLNSCHIGNPSPSPSHASATLTVERNPE